MCEAEQGSGLLTTFLEQNDAACPVCGHSLRELQSSKCPECGAALKLRVGSENLKLGTWIALLLALTIPYGFGTIAVGFRVIEIIYYDGLDRFLAYLIEIWPLMALSGLTSLLLSLAILGRRRYWKLRRAMQWLWLCSAIAIMSVALGLCLWWRITL